MVGYRDDLTPEVARTLVDLNDMAFVTTGLLLGLYAAAGWVCLAHRVLARWLGWFGFVSGVLAVGTAVIGMVDPDSYFRLPLLAGLIWTLMVSVVLTGRPLPAVQGRRPWKGPPRLPGERSGRGSPAVRAGRHWRPVAPRGGGSP